MNNSDPNNAHSRIDFSNPPPGYFVPRNYESSRSTPEHGSMMLPKNEPGRSPEPSYSTDSMYSYYQGSNYRPGFTIQRTQSQQNLDHSKSYTAQPPPIPPETTMSIDPRLFNLPPPPPPMESFPPNIPLHSGGYILSKTVFAIPTSPSGVGPIRAGQYVSQQPGNSRLSQFQGDYSNGFSRRCGFHSIRKRKMSQENDRDGSKRASAKKKKKPLSQNIPSKKDWTLEDAKRALDVERDFNKRHKSPSLIIKFPDLELNRDIVSKFHPQIESVHFQQPSTPRFCFVTLKDSSCIDEVIQQLCKIKFGSGYLTAETKNNKEEDLVKGPEDIDPLTLYVGNLAQEVTVDDVVKAYPKHKRIDIGFAKKMKYTRYAFVCFRTVDDAIEAFQNTHASEMYNKSLIVRFRRLHGTVGLPGDPKQHNSQKRSDSQSTNASDTCSNDFDVSDKLKSNFSAVSSPNSQRDATSPLNSGALDRLFNDDDRRFNHNEASSTNGINLNVPVKTELVDPELDSLEELVHVPIQVVKTELDDSTFQVKQEPPEPDITVKKEVGEQFDDITDKDVQDYSDDVYLSDSSF